MRRGNFFFPKSKLSIASATGFVGTQVAVYAVSYLLVSTIVGLVFTVLVHPLLWKYLYENIVLIIVTIAINILTTILQCTLLKYLLDPFKGVKHRRYSLFFINKYLNMIDFNKFAILFYIIFIFLINF